MSDRQLEVGVLNDVVGGRGQKEPVEIISALRANGLVIVCHAATRVVTELNTEEPALRGRLFMR